MAKKTRTAEEFRGQLMLQIAAGRFFRPGVPINEHAHRRTIYSNASLLESVDLPVGKLIPSTDIGGDIWTAMLEAVDRLEAQRWDGTDDFMIATGGDNLIDDIAYVMTFALNRTFTRDHDQIHRLVPTTGTADRRRGAANLFPQLFTPMEVIRPPELDDFTEFMSGLIEMPREDFARVMRVIRTTIDATRRAVDDPTGAYTDLVASLESLAEDANTTATTWDRYDSKKRKIIDTALQGASDDIGHRLRAAVLEADRLGLKRRFVSGTVSRIAPEYFRTGAVGAIRPPRSAEIERMLAIAHDIRSKRSHVLTDLGEEAWVYTNGAETAFEPNFQRMFTLAGLWRLVRHVVRRYIIGATKTSAEPWDYREALPGIIKMQLAPQYWVWQPEGPSRECRGDPEHPARVRAREYKKSVAARLTETAREAGATGPELLGEQLALLFDGASARTRTVGADAIPTAAGIAVTLIEHAIPETTPPPRATERRTSRPRHAQRAVASAQ